jgi:calcineurin-like phosphoesterase
MEKKPIVQRFLDSMPAKFAVAEGDVQMNTVQIEVDEATGRASSIERVNFRLD